MAHRNALGTEPQPAGSATAAEPIAVVGMGCRLPGGVDSPETYWRLLLNATDAVREVPSERWAVSDHFDPEPGRPGKTYVRHMAALDDIDRFDAAFFGISPREAATIDPQQRLLLEVAWEALENAGYAPRGLAGSQTGVFVGIFSDDYAQSRLYDRDPEQIDGHTGLSLMRGLAAGRVAYHLDLHGPVLAVDTACSSSLLAIHLACRSLQAGECDLALAGGVNLVLSPEVTIGLSQMRAMSASGRCRTFSAGADGYVRGEGCGVVVLKRLRDALADGDEICAVVRGSAVNHDGRSNGLSAPNGQAQRAVIAAALSRASLAPEAVGYVEAHGTGTILGDPIEVQALGDALCTDRSTPLAIGSVKTNVGHLEAAAGVAAFMKVVLALRHSTIPPHLHFDEPNPLIPWEKLPVTVPVAPTPWPADQPVAGISAFGMSGTNVHVLLERGPQLGRQSRETRPRHLLALSARDDEGLARLARRYAAALKASPEIDPADLCLSANAGRDHFSRRLGIPFTDLRDLAAQLDHAPQGVTAPSGRPSVAFLFSDQTSFAPGLGQSLYDTQPVFRKAVLHCRAIIAALGDGTDRPSGKTDPAFDLFCLQYGLSAMWRSWGIEPSHVIGFGAGEIAAACAAGMMDCEAAVALMAARRRAIASPDRDAARFNLIRAVRGLGLKAPLVPIISGCLGHLLGVELTSPSYWAEQAFSEADIAAGLACLDEEPTVFRLEVGPASSMGADPRILRGLHQDANAWEELLGHLKALYEAGAAIDWRAVDGPYASGCVPLPTYPFAETRYAVPRPHRIRGQRTTRGFAVERLDLADSQEQRFQLRIGGSDHAFLRDHRIFGTPVLPAAAYIELALRIGSKVLGASEAVENLALLRPLTLPETGEILVQAICSADGNLKLFGRPAAPDPQETWILHATCRIAPAKLTPQSLMPIPHEGELSSGASIYDSLEVQGLGYGPAFRSLVSVTSSGNETVGHAVLPIAAQDSMGDFDFHPSLLDACFIACSKILPDPGSGRTWLPVGIDHIAFSGPLGKEVFCHVRSMGADGAGRCTAEIALSAASGVRLGTIEGVAFQSVRQGVPAAPAAKPTVSCQTPDVYQVAWRPVEPAAATDPHTRWLVLADAGGTGEQIARNLSATFDVTVRPVGSASPEELAHWLAGTVSRSNDKPRRILYCGGLDATGDPTAMASDCKGLLQIVQVLARLPKLTTVRLDVVTRASQRVNGNAVSKSGIAQATLWGLARVARREYEDLGIALFDLDAEAHSQEAKEFTDLLVATEAGEECALRGGQTYAARLVAQAAPMQGETALQLPAPETRPPGPGEIAIDVIASGMNFRDVLHSLGMLPDSADAMPFGLECSGRIAAVGPGVEGFECGMPVIAGLTVGSLGGRVNVPVEFVVKKPEAISFRDAATLPLAFITAHHSLVHLAHLQAGQKVLIHAAAGGVGQAAIQIARRIGAEIFATASPGKWDFLRSQGIRHIFNSRTTDFATAILAATGGEGIDVVLNSLSGEFIPKSLSVLKSGGHFVDIGKIGVWTREQVDALGRGLDYHRFDLWDVKRDRALIARTMREMVRSLADGSLVPLPCVTFPVCDAQAAFQYMARARHVGKIVIWQSSEGQGDLIRPDATYLVAGGLGGLGLSTASWLIARGARHVALVSRRSADEAARSAIVDLARSGVQVLSFAADIADDEAVLSLFSELADRMPPVRGIIHAAGILDDGFLAQQSEERFRRVLAAKVTGAWNLHRCAEGLALDHFILFSSASGLLGTAGQGNYASANAGLDALAHHRASLGLPALSIDWGPWAEIGMAAGRSLGDRGMGRIAPAAAHAVLDQCLTEPSGQIAVVPVDWPAFLKWYRHVPPLLREWAPRGMNEQVEGTSRFREKLDAAAPAERARLLRQHVRALVAKSLDLSDLHTLDPAQELSAVGFDSLMGMELKAALDKSLAVTLRSTLTYDYPSIEAITLHLIDVLGWIPLPTPKQRQSETPVSDMADAEAALLDELNQLNY